MDIIRETNLVAPPALKQNVQQAQPLPRPFERRDVQQAQPQTSDALAQDKQSLEEAVANMQGAAQAIQRNLNFSIDDSTGRMVVKVTDSASGEVIRQMPTEEALRLAESLDEMRSLLFSAQA